VPNELEVLEVFSKKNSHSLGMYLKKHELRQEMGGLR
jgi:hypothetical protein